MNPPSQESTWQFLSQEEILEKFGIDQKNILAASAGSLEFSIRQKYEGTPLWKWFVAGTLLFLVIEIALIKLWK
ncbi:MAG: hypothetical protein U5L96_02715 [Owenweeksia sp.]|nr:hypothetical protein [Owenweeksia sp.]